MQTIDLGNITIGGDAPQCPAAPEMPHLEEETHTACEEAHTPHEPQPCGQGNSACESAATILPSNIAGGICFQLAAGIQQPEVGGLLGVGGTLPQYLLTECLEAHGLLGLIGLFQCG